MTDIFENTFLYIDYPINFLGTFIVIFLFILYFFYFFYFKNIIKNKKILKNQKTDFLQLLKNLDDEKFTEEILKIFTKFLEEKTWNENISKMSFYEIEKLKLDRDFTNFYEKIYFLNYSKKHISDELKSHILFEFQNILKN